ncbi:MAG: 50S ribosomal protein L25 [Clostridia bacterium]|nr:50S ribosomal protein L25 [Clostridia bacterium]
MNINTLICEKRDPAAKASKIRKNGFVPAVVYGRHIDSLSIQIKQDAATKFLQLHSTGSKALLEIDGEEQPAILQDFQRDPLSRKILHIEFHALTSGEKVKVTLPVNFMNRDSLEQDMLLHIQMSEIEISALPEFLVDHANIDISKYTLGDSVYVSDLDISSNENIEVMTPPEALVCTITHASRLTEEPAADEEEPEAVAAPKEATEK